MMNGGVMVVPTGGEKYSPPVVIPRVVVSIPIGIRIINGSIGVGIIGIGIIGVVVRVGIIGIGTITP